MDVVSLPIADLSQTQADIQIANYINNNVGGKFILNTSLGYGNRTDPIIGPFSSDEIKTRLAVAKEWRRSISPALSRMFLSSSAGNENAAYENVEDNPQDRIPDLNSPYNLTSRLQNLAAIDEVYSVDVDLSTNFLAWLSDTGQALPSALLVGASDDTGMIAPFSNTANTAFPNKFADVRAPGNTVFGRYCPSCPVWTEGFGTSFAAPIVSGLAAYLWNLAPELSPEEIRNTIKSSYNQHTEGLIDAYSAVLSLDSSPTNAPVRCAILDLSSSDDPQANCQFNGDDAARFVDVAYNGFSALELVKDPTRFDLMATTNLAKLVLGIILNSTLRVSYRRWRCSSLI